MTTDVDNSGRLNPQGPAGAPILHGLTPPHFQAVLAGHALALRAADFCDPGVSVEIARRLADKAAFGSNPYSPKIGCVGIAFQSTVNNPALRAQYYEKARFWEESLRTLVAPAASPADVLIGALHRMWPAGVNVESVEGRPMFAGGTRVFLEGAAAPPHQDILARDVEPGNETAASIRVQLAASVYLSTTPAGGELELWDWKPCPPEFAPFCKPGLHNAERDRLADPSATIKPAPGELIVYDAGKVHAARAAGAGLRAAVSMFVAFRRCDLPLTVWS
jgi:hypothetical protein